jgi:hypothetical protein
MKVIAAMRLIIEVFSGTTAGVIGKLIC